MTGKPIQGSVTAMVTPFTSGGGSIDEPALRDLVDRLVEDGIDALLPCGGTGEFASLTTDERRRVHEVVLEQNAGRLAVLAHTGALFTAEAVRLSQHAAELGADALMVSTPFYEPLSVEDATAYYAAVAESVDTPICLYNYPNATGLNLDAAAVAAIAAAIPSVEYVKDSSADFKQYVDLLQHRAVTPLCGEDVLLGAVALLGAPGVVVGTSNVIGPGVAALLAARDAGDTGRVVEIWEQLTPFIQTAASMPYTAAMKAACAIVGHPVGEMRAPGRALTAAEYADLRASIEALDASLLTKA